MMFVKLAKHSVELLVVVFVLYIGFLTLTPGAKALNEFMASDGSSSDHSYHMSRGYRFGRSSSFHFSAGMIRPSRLK